MDINKVATLLLVEEKTRELPPLKVVHDKAWTELVKIAQEVEKEIEDEKKKVAAAPSQPEEEEEEGMRR